jgi:hypothetical protein
VYGEEKNFALRRLEQPMQDKNILCLYDKPNQPTKEGPLSYVLLEPPFASVSTVSRGHPLLASLVFNPFQHLLEIIPLGNLFYGFSGVTGILQNIAYTAKTQYRKFETNIPRKGTERLQSQFLHSCFCERFTYSPDRSAYSDAGKWVDRTWEYINRSQTHECGKLALRPRNSFNPNFFAV